MSQHDVSFHHLLDRVMDHGERIEGRNGGTRSIFGAQVQYDLRQGFPLLTTKLVPWRMAFAEMFWFISGSSDIAGLLQVDHAGNEVDARKLWSPWATNREFDGDAGPLYGVQWRKWGQSCWDGPARYRVDQLADAVETLRDPSKRSSRRIIVSAWNASDIEDMALPPCHAMFQFAVRPGERLDMMLWQRSCDLPIGAPFNVAQYAMLQTLVARLAGLTPGVLTHSIGDAHVYENQVESVERWREQARANAVYLQDRVMLGFVAPKLEISEFSQSTIDDFALAQVRILGYSHLGRVEIPVSV